MFGGQAIVHVDARDRIRALTDDLIPVGDVDLVPTLSAEDAIAAVGAPEPLAPDPEADAAIDTAPTARLWLLRRDEQVHLAWSVSWAVLDVDEPTAPRVFVDAHDGLELWRYDDLQTVQIQNATRYDGTQPLEVYQTGGTKYLEDPIRDFVTLSSDRFGYLYYVSTTSSTFSDTTLAQLHHGTTTVEDYYQQVHGRDGIDGAGGPGSVARVETGVPALAGAAHYGNRYNNAFWSTGSQLFVAGDGNGSLFSPLVSLDVVAHEFTHGVTEHTANLTYANESGALNESMSDVFGAAAEAFGEGAVSADTWWIGEDCYTPGTANDALRYMEDPTADGASRDHYDHRYTGTADNGGVHYNSGIGNLAFYPVSEGGNHPTYGGVPITGLGIDVAEQIWYRGLTTYATASTDFQGMRVATLLAAEDLYGTDSTEEQVVDAAWALVGVDPWVLLPQGWASSGVGAPSVVYRKPTGQMVMAFESMTEAPSADCPNGKWSIGLATSTTGRDFTMLGTPALAPVGGTWRSCVVAHPTLMVDETGTGYDLWFKAEQDDTTCGGDAACLYSGIGYAHVSGDFTTVTVASTPVVTTSQVMGYPSVVNVSGTYTMMLQSHPDLYVATADVPEGPWTLDPTPVTSIGVTSWAADEVFNPALVCEFDTLPNTFPYSDYFGGRQRDGTWGDVLDGGVGHAVSQDGTSWQLSVATLYAFVGNERWRHWSALRHGSGVVFYYSETVGGANRIGVKTKLTSWSKTGLSPRTCPRPAWW
ncbi:MAG: M4 family metallopeptidase [Alphaproteobacteria bacterium]|nr:M4 family metallopeptidase [Alphaproteobacteria bacterium]MCB9696260.1 M4 family metallopeptidase [Alphaproteobacteria bacterium]